MPTLREMFTPGETCGNLDRMKRLWREMEEAGRMAAPLRIEEPETDSEPSQQLDALNDVLTATLSEPREPRLPSAGAGLQTGMISTSGLSRREAESLIGASIGCPTTIRPSHCLPGSRTRAGSWGTLAGTQRRLPPRWNMTMGPPRIRHRFSTIAHRFRP